MRLCVCGDSSERARDRLQCTCVPSALLREMGVDVDEPTVLLVDNSGAVELFKHQKACHRSRHVKRRYLKVRELVAEGEVVVQWFATKENPSDLLSKGTIEPAQFNRMSSSARSWMASAAPHRARADMRVATPPYHRARGPFSEQDAQGGKGGDGPRRSGYIT